MSRFLILDIPRLTISKSAAIPQIGFGLWQNKNENECIRSVQEALRAGYRHFDTAQIYGNEAYLGKALASTNVPREELFITTKVWLSNFGPHRLRRSVDESLQKLQLEFVDLLLLHFPVPVLRGRAWRTLESLQAEGMVRAIGVSNFTIRHLEHLRKHAKITPAVNQVELHVFLQQPKLLAYCRDHGIVVEAYSPLAHGKGMDEPLLALLADKYERTPAQIMLRWCVQQGTVPLPKSTHTDRIQQNIAIFDFELTPEDMQTLSQLNKNLRTCWNPTRLP